MTLLKQPVECKVINSELCIAISDLNTVLPKLHFFPPHNRHHWKSLYHDDSNAMQSY